MSDTNTLPEEDHSKSSPVLVLAATAAVCTVIIGILPTIPGIPAWVIALVGAVGAAATAILGVITKGQVTPWKNVVAMVTPRGRVAAGPAANAVTPETMPVATGDTVEVYKTAA